MLIKHNTLGKLFGRLEAIEGFLRDKHNNCQWVCSCLCDNVVVVHGHSLISGYTKSCGCFGRDVEANFRVNSWESFIKIIEIITEVGIIGIT